LNLLGKNLFAEIAKSNSSDPTSVSVLHSVNLAVLQNFYNLSNVMIYGRDLFDSTKLVDPQPVDWPLFSQNTSRLLAADTATGYSLNELVDSLQNNSVVLHSSFGALLCDFID